MGVRFHRSNEILPGIRLNFSKSGVGISLGKKGFRYSIGPKGNRMTVGIPGTGLSYTTTSSARKRQTDSELEEHPYPVYISQSEALQNPDTLIKKLGQVNPEEIKTKSNIRLCVGIAIGIFFDVIAIYQMFFR